MLPTHIEPADALLIENARLKIQLAQAQEAGIIESVKRRYALDDADGVDLGTREIRRASRPQVVEGSSAPALKAVE